MEKPQKLIAFCAICILTIAIIGVIMYTVAWQATKEKRGDKMNVNKLKGKIVENGLTIPELAKSVDIDRATMYRKLNNGDKIKIGEAIRIKRVLNLTDREAVEIFLT